MRMQKGFIGMYDPKSQIQDAGLWLLFGMYSFDFTELSGFWGSNVNSGLFGNWVVIKPNLNEFCIEFSNKDPLFNQRSCYYEFEQ